jgi:DNA repair protein RadC
MASLREDAYKPPILSTSDAVVQYLQAELAHSPVEQVRVLFLGSRNQLLRDALVSIGSVDESPLYPREIMRQALEVNATGLILVHNHPSGDFAPSKGDEQATRQVVEAARTLDIRLHDHLIIAKGGYSSFRAIGLL